MEHFQITSKPRHLRYVFFVDENYPYEDLLLLVQNNQKLWGGRYNPIVPVKDNIILDRWTNVLKFYDPDYIFYSKEIDPEIIKRLQIFNPCAYINIEDRSGQHVSGVNSFYLLSQFDIKSRIILTKGISSTGNPLLSYFKTNYGFETSLYHHEMEISRNFDRTIVDEKEFKLLNKFIADLKPINQSHLSRRHLNTLILRSKNYANTHAFEIVIAKDKSSNADLFYYWNRMLFELRNILYMTVEELNVLCDDENFGQVLYNMDWENPTLVTSQSLTKDELQEIINTRLKKTNSNRLFESRKIDDFPFDVLDAQDLFERNPVETSTTQTLYARKGFIHLPKLSFLEKTDSSQGWALDIHIKHIKDGYENNFELPLTTETQYIVNNVKGRINKKRSISISIRNLLDTSNTLNIHIPEFSNLLRQLIISPVIAGETKNTKYVNIGLDDPGNRLSAFLKSFNYNFDTIVEFFTDKFWVSIFESLSQGEKAIGDAILFEDILLKAKNELEKKGSIVLNESRKLIGKKGQNFRNEESLIMGLQNTLSELCGYRLFLKGFNLKCTTCSSQFWYHLDEVKETITCKGCFETFQFPVEPKFAYKLNNLIKNNIFQPSKLRDGNLTVIRTLASIQGYSYRSFYYSPQINLYDNHRNNTPCTDIDIICLSNGQFIIGEAKHDSIGFNEKNDKGECSLDKLEAIAKAILPDKIILSCYVDTSDKLAKAKQYLDGKFYKSDYKPDIEIILLSPPDYFHLGNYRYFLY